MAPFRCLSEHELQQLSDEELIAYANEARDSGKPESWLLAMKMLVWGFHRRVEFWVRRRVDPGEVEDLVSEVFARALTSLSRDTAKFTGSTEGEFGAWLKRITQFVVADFHRGREGDPPIGPLGPGNGDDDDPHGPEPFDVDHADKVAIQTLVEQAFDELQKELHKRVIKIVWDVEYGFDGKSPPEAVEEITKGSDGEPPEQITLDNVYKIKSRFGIRVEALKEDADNPGGTDG